MNNGQLFIAKSKEPLNIRWSRQLAYEPSSITISKDRAGRYFVSMLCEFEANPMPVSNKTAGIDLGLTDLFIITPDGKKSGNPRHTRRYEQKLAYPPQKQKFLSSISRNPRYGRYSRTGSWLILSGESVLKQEGSWSDLRILAR